MSYDDKAGYFDDGCFIDAPSVLSEKEYFAEVLFHDGLQSIRSSKFKLDLPFEINKGGTIAFNFGDLLVYVPISERLKWKEFYQGINTIQIDYADKLLFFDFRNSRDVKTVQDYWQKRVDNLLETEDQPWFTKKEKQRMSQELHFLKQPGQPVPIEESRGIKSMYFKRELLAKYRKNELCEIGSEHIKFLRHDKMTAASTVKFLNRNFANIDGIVLMMRALDYINVPPTERPHWSRYEIPESQINF